MGHKWQWWLPVTATACLIYTCNSMELPVQADESSNSSSTAAPDAPLRGPVIKKTAPTTDDHNLRKTSSKHIRKDMWIAYRMAKAPWLDKAAEADPSIVAAICAHPGPARVLAGHYRIAEIAKSDHYLCRRLTRWKGATWALVHNPHADRVIALDPEGIYRAIERNPMIARILAHSNSFNEMIMDNPDLGQFIAMHMK